MQSMATSPANARTCGLASCSYTVAQAFLGSKHSSVAFQLQEKARAQRVALSWSRVVQCRASGWRQEGGHVEFPAALSAAGLLAGSALIWLGQSHPALAASMHSSQLPEFHPVAADIQDLASNVRLLTLNHKLSHLSISIATKIHLITFAHTNAVIPVLPLSHFRRNAEKGNPPETLRKSVAGGFLEQPGAVRSLLHHSAAGHRFDGYSTTWRLAEASSDSCGGCGCLVWPFHLPERHAQGHAWSHTGATDLGLLTARGARNHVKTWRLLEF